jgi:signal transduction histidine kinase
MASSFPINVIWGPGYVQIWNEGYAGVCGEKHPGDLGSDYRECWASAWPAIGQAFEAACTGETAFLENQPMFLDRNGYLEETSFTFSLSPIRDETGHVVGLFHPVTETTPRMLSERRTRTLRDLASCAADARDVPAATKRSLDVLAGAQLDLPLLLLYLIDDDDRCARLVGNCGLEPGQAISPRVIDLAEPDSDGPVARVLREGETMRLTDLASEFGAVHAGPFPEPLEQALLVPVMPPGVERPMGVLVAGLSTRLPHDETYLGFVDLVGAGITSAFANAVAYEQERRRAEALAEIDSAKTEFFSNVSHEFRTPLTLMLGPLEDELADSHGLAPLRRERLETAHRNSLRLLRLVNSLLDFSRIESGRVKGSYIPTDLAAYTTDLASQFRSTVERAGLRLVVDCEPLPEPVLVDRDMWEKLVLNLLSNAFKHTFQGGIAVTLKWCCDSAELAVTDTGVGIAADELSRLFERFHRVKDASSRSFEGTGIGLALVQEIAQLHGGHVMVESQPGRGSRFTARVRAGRSHLPADQIADAVGPPVTSGLAVAYSDEAMRWLTSEDSPASSEADGTAERPASDDGAPRTRVLVADDNEDMRTHLRRLLEPHFEVTAVSDGAAALKIALAEPPDLVLSDVMMPQLDGFGLLAALREDERTRTVPVIMLSARAGEEAALDGIEAGADDYLVKPFTARELIARVSGSLALARLRRETAERLEVVNRELAAATHAKNEFLSRMSHELRTPLNAVIGFGQLLELDDLDPSQHEGVEQILKAGRHLLALINEVLDISRIESGTMSMSLEPVHLGSVLAEALSLIRPLADEAQVRLIPDPAELAEVHVLADHQRLKQVVINLLSNAVKYNRRGGEISACCNELLDGGVELAIADSGRGMSAEQLERLFDPFDRLGAERTDIEGTGLGLALSMRLVEAMGGTIKAESQPETGTTMRVKLERAEGPDDEAATEHSASTAGNGSPRGTLLYIEDNLSNLKLVERLIDRVPGVRLIPAMQGKLGVELARQHHPDLILLDLHLPDLHGREVLQQLKHEPDTAAIPVVILSADATPGQVELLKEAGAADFMTKPIDIDLLLKTITGALQTKTPELDEPRVAH